MKYERDPIFNFEPWADHVRQISANGASADISDRTSPTIQPFASLDWHGTGLLAAAFLLAGVAGWSSLSAPTPLIEPSSALSIDSILRETPTDLPTLSADTF